jgi:hypothetical protein
MDGLSWLRGMKLTVQRIATLPPLAWAAEIHTDKVRVCCGDAVEANEASVVAGAWAGPFSGSTFAEAATSIGTGLVLSPRGLVGAVGTAGTAPLHLWRGRGRRRGEVVIANSLALALAVAEDRLQEGFPFYPHLLYSLVLGPDRYRAEIPTANGRLAVLYRSMLVEKDGRMRALAPSAVPGFSDFAAYRALLLSEIAALFANAADPLRRWRFSPIASMSAGYDSTAAATLAREAGCRQAVTFRHSLAAEGVADDSGEHIAKALGLDVTAFDTFEYRTREDLPEIEFLSASYGGGNVYLAAAGELVKGRIVVSGGGGDFIWGRDYADRRPPPWPPYLGGYSVNEFYLRQGALDFSVPAIATVRARDIGRISRSAEMQRWTIGGDYDRPIARRILEEAGVPRGSFAERKRLISPSYDSLTRRAPPLDGFLSRASLQAFERWFAETRPIHMGRAFRQRLLVETLAKIVWSGKIRRWFQRRGLRWPPFAGRVWHWRVPVRKNAFVFQWAVERQIAFYRRALGR